MIDKYLCMNCVYYMKCEVNAGIMRDFVKDASITYLEERDKNHILVFECEKFKQRDIEYGPELPLPDDDEAVCRVCGKTFVRTYEDRTICSDPRCKTQSRLFRKSRKRG